MRRLPRLALLMLCVAYVVPGFLGRNPWKSADVAAFGVMRDLAAGQLGWLDVATAHAGAEGLLPYWLGAAAIHAQPWLDPAVAARVPFALLLGLTLAACWYAVYHLARLPQAQPVAFAFGGEAQSTDYARAMADGALLALLACLGLGQLGHETTATLVQLSMVALLLYATAAARWSRWRPLATFAVAQMGLALSASAPLALALGGAATLLHLLAWRQTLAPGATGQEPAARRMVVAMGCISLAVGLAAWAAHMAGVHAIRLDVAVPGWANVPSLARLYLWFTWPAWPLAIWALWRWRRQIGSLHVCLPVTFVALIVVDAMLTPSADRALLPALPALAALAAFALPTLHRSVSALIDWFTLLFFSGCGFVIWVIWLSLHTGVPAKPAANVARLAPGFEPYFSYGGLLIALLATASWIWLVKWRAGRHRSAIWKSLALPAGGAVLCWVLLMTLWLPMLDYARSYAPLTRKLTSLMGQTPCVQTHGLSPAQTAGISWHSGWKLVAAPGGQTCPWLLVDQRARQTLPQVVDASAWTLVSTFRRPADKDEDVMVFRRASSAAR